MRDETNRRTENIHIYSEERLISPAALKALHPLTEKATDTVLAGHQATKNILNHKDCRIFIVLGPCSIHDREAALDYAQRLKKLADEVNDTLVLVMRTYFEKPRTSVGWEGYINDPYLDNSRKVEEGLKLGRKLLCSTGWACGGISLRR